MHAPRTSKPRSLTTAVAIMGLLSAGAPASVLTAGCRTTQAPVAQRSEPAAPPADPGIRFVNAAAEAGLRHRWPEQKKPLTTLDAFGCGCAFLDYDADGWLDIILVAKPNAVLYRNLRNGRFKDVTKSTGLDLQRGDWKGCAVGDADGDGFVDLILTGYRSLVLLRNEAGRRWTAAASSALPRDNGGKWGSGGGFMDLDGDGDLDLVLLNYLEFGPNSPQLCEPWPGVKTGCPPRLYPPEFPELWENLGEGRMRNATATSGMNDATGTSQVLAFTDVDVDGRMDFYVGNDGTPADLMHNLGGLRFENKGVESGIAYGAGLLAIAAMGADWADYDGDGRLDLFVTAFSDEPFSLLRNTGSMQFEHAGEQTGIAAATLTPLGFGANFLDMDNDGWPDLAIANGHIYDAAARGDKRLTFRQPIMLLHNQGGKSFRDLIPLQAAELREPILGRGTASGDFDNDGRIDWLAVDYEGAPLLLHNRSETPNHWLTLDLRSRNGNHLAYGARVEAKTKDRTWVGQVSPACSYLSSSDPRVHFGLGAVEELETLVISWPSGETQTLRNVAVDRVLAVTEVEAQ